MQPNSLVQPGVRGIGKYLQTQTLQIMLGSGGALPSDGDADLKSYASNLSLYISHYQVKVYAIIILIFKKVSETRTSYVAFLLLQDRVSKCNVRRFV